MTRKKEDGGWGAVHGELWSHPKVMQLMAMGEAEAAPALALWLRAFSFIQSQPSLYGDGALPDGIVSMLGFAGGAENLCKVGLWQRETNKWVFTDWKAWQKGAQNIRKVRQEAGRKSGFVRRKSAEAKRNQELKIGNKSRTKARTNDEQKTNTSDYRLKEKRDKKAGRGSLSLKPKEGTETPDGNHEHPTDEQHAPAKRRGRLAAGVAQAMASEDLRSDPEETEDRVSSADFGRWKSLIQDALLSRGQSVSVRRGRSVESPWERAADAAVSHSRFHGCSLAVSVGIQVEAALSHRSWAQKPAFVISDTPIPKPPPRRDELSPLGPPREDQ